MTQHEKIEWLMKQVRCLVANGPCGPNPEPGGTSIHNELEGKQGGSEELNEFYHSTKAEHDLLEEITLNNTIDKILDIIAVPPTYTQPISILNAPNTTYEVGTSIQYTITQIFVQNDAGLKISEVITKNGIVVSTSDTFGETIVVPLGNTVFGGSVSYGEGPCFENNLGIIDCTGHIEEGQTTSPTRTMVGALRRYAGSVSNIPASGEDLRTALLSTSSLSSGNTFTFNTGTVNRRFVIAVPATKTLVSVQNTGTNEFLTFTLSPTLTQVPDVSGTNHNYKVYTLENAVPFSSNYILNVTLN